MMKKLISLVLSVGVLFLFSTGAFAAQKPEVYVGVADQYLDPIYNPNLWDYVRQNSDGFYVNFIELDNWYTQSIVNSYASLHSKKNGFIESDMNSTQANEQGYINKLQAAGFKVPYTSLNYGWDATRQSNLKNYNLLSGQSPRLCLVQNGPWTIGGNIAGDNGENSPYTNAQYRSWISQADGDSTDGPMGYWYTDNRQMRAGSYSMVNYAQNLGKKALVMISPYWAEQASYNIDMFLDVAKSCVISHEDNNADPDIWAIFEYATSGLDAVPEKKLGGAPHNSTTGVAYYLIKHINGDPGTLDMYVTPDSGSAIGQYVFSPTIDTTNQIAVFNPNVAAGTVYHYTVKLTDSSSWCDYAAILKAVKSGSTDAWTVQFKLGGTDITGSVMGSGYKFYQNNRLNSMTSKTVDVYLTRTSAAGDANMNLDMSLLPHNGSNAVDSMRIASALGSVPAPPAVQTPISRTDWTISASQTIASDPPANAIDGNINTRWTSGTGQSFGQWFKIDMGITKTINKLVLQSNGSFDYPREYELYLSTDGTNWGSPVAKAIGSNDVTTITFPSTNARYCRINQIANDSSHWWSINEVNAYWDGTPVVTPSPAPPSGTFEAENAVLTGGAKINKDHTGYTGTGFLDSFGNHAGAAVSFTVNAQSAGYRDVTLRYCAGTGTRTLGVYVNGTKVKDAVLNGTANWNTWATETDMLYLSSGNNTITYRAEDIQAVNVDNIVVSPVTTYQAENATLSGGAKVNTDHTGYTGTGFVDGYGGNVGASTTFTVNSQTAGNADIMLRYSAGAGSMTIGLYVNGTKVKDINLGATSNWDTWATKIETVYLNSGNNTVTYRADAAPSMVNIDSITK